MGRTFTFVALALALVGCGIAEEIPEYVQQCKASDPQLIECITGAINHLRPYLSRGIPEIELPTIEPFTLGDLSLALSTGPTGYKINLRNVQIYGASNYSLSKLKLGEGTTPFEARVKIPKLKITAKYTSSGVLFIIPASGNGSFHAIFDGVTADLKGVVSKKDKPDGKHLHVDSLEVDLKVKNPQMQVKRIFNNNRILVDATNLFLRENGQEVLRAMIPQLRDQLGRVFKRIVNQLMSHVKLSLFYLE